MEGRFVQSKFALLLLLYFYLEKCILWLSKDPFLFLNDCYIIFQIIQDYFYLLRES